MRFLELHVVRRLAGKRVEVGADGDRACRLQSVVALVAEEGVVVLADLLVQLEGQDPLRSQGAGSTWTSLGARRSGCDCSRARIPLREALHGCVGDGRGAARRRERSSHRPQHRLVGAGLGRLQAGHVVQNRGGEGRRREWSLESTFGRTKRKPSVSTKKNVLSLRMGPPTEAAHWLALEKGWSSRSSC